MSSHQVDTWNDNINGIEKMKQFGTKQIILPSGKTDTAERLREIMSVYNRKTGDVLTKKEPVNAYDNL
jgi:hypothetical protein